MKLPPGHVPGMGVHKATAYGGFGQKMLEKMGWSKGQGLGKEKHGMKEAIEVKKKEDNLGVGANTTGWKWDWKYWEDAYNVGIQNLSKDERKKKRQRTSSSSSSSGASSSSSDTSSSSASDSDSDGSSDSDDEHNARIAEACGVVFNRDGTAASASAAELKLAQELAKDSRGRAGRFGGREGKMARIRQQEAEQAAAMQEKLGIVRSASTGNLGGSSASEDTSAGKSKRKRKQSAAATDNSSGADAETADAAADARNGGKSKKRKNNSQDSQAVQLQQQQQEEGKGPSQPAAAAANKQRIVVVVDIKGAGPNVEAFKSFQPTPSSGWWGAKMFTSAGLLEGLDQEQQQKQRQRTTFDEDMQTRVYMEAHDAQRQGRRGLGKSTTLKIAGGNWQGKKVTFDQEAAGVQDAEATEQPIQQQQQHTQLVDAADRSARDIAVRPAEAVSQTVQNSKTESKKKKQKAYGKPGKVKWAQLAVTELQGVPGGVLKWSKLWKQLKQAAEQQQAVLDEKCREKAWKKVQGCSQLQVSGKLISLVA